jgi:hypothetical protein
MRTSQRASPRSEKQGYQWHKEHFYAIGEDDSKREKT